MNASRVPPPMKEAARKVFQETVALRTNQPGPPVEASTHAEEHEPGLSHSPAVDLECAESKVVFAPLDGEEIDDVIIRSFLLFSQEDTTSEIARFARAADTFAQRVQRFLSAESRIVTEEVIEGDTSPPVISPTSELREKVSRWLSCWREWERMWRVWQRPHRTPPALNPAEVQGVVEQVLSADQTAAVERLTAVFRAREGSGAFLPRAVLARWGHPVLVGPSGAGKTFVVQEAARRLGLAYGSWELGAWLIAAGRSNRATIEQIERFCACNPQGTVVHLAGLDAFSAARISAGDGNVSWWGSVLAEVEQFMDWAAVRNVSGEQSSPLRPFVVTSARFPALWGGQEVGGPSGVNAWRTADDHGLSTSTAVADWLKTEGQMPSSVMARVTSPPLLVGRIGKEEAMSLGKTICAMLPSALDGIINEAEAAEALAGPDGWRGLTRCVEAQLVGMETPFPMSSNTVDQPSS